MNKDKIQYLNEIFIPKMEEIGYKLVQKNIDLYRFSYKENLFFNIFFHKNFLQGICLFNIKEKQVFSIHSLYLLNVNPVYLERLKEADECFYFDNKDQFVGILNCFYDLLKRNTESLVNNGIKKLMKGIVHNSNLHQHVTKDFLLEEIKRKAKWQESIRFIESDLLS